MRKDFNQIEVYYGKAACAIDWLEQNGAIETIEEAQKYKRKNRKV